MGLTPTLRLERSISIARDWCQGLSPWRRRGLALITGAASILAFAPFFFWPILWLTLPPLLWLGAGAERPPAAQPGRRFPAWASHPIAHAAGIGWWWGFGFHLVGLFWIGEAFLVDAETFAWLIPFVVTLLPAGLALFTALTLAITSALAPAGPLRVPALAVAFGATEWLRGHILTGFPWNVLGYALTSPLAMMQSASVFGIYGLTVLAAVVFACPVILDGTRRGRILVASAAVLPLVVLAGLGAIRLAVLQTDSRMDEARPAPLVRIVQVSVPQHEKWRPENQRKIFDDHLALSRQRPDGSIDDAVGVALLVWPESAMPFRPLDTPVALSEIGRVLGDHTLLVAGAIRAEPEPSTPGTRRVFNSLIAFGPGGEPISIYDKAHLVPFGEYLPLRPMLEAIGLRQLTQMRGGFASGDQPRPLMVLPALGAFGPLICYEAIFPGPRFAGDGRAAALINLTNDGWFGNTTGPRQHLHQARVRAVETGLPLIRAANNGISGVVDPFGRLSGRIELNIRGTSDTRLPQPLPATIYDRWGDGLFFALEFCLMAFIFRTRGRAAVAVGFTAGDTPDSA